MKKYVIDTNIFSHAFNNLNFEVFSEFWEAWEKMIFQERVISVSESYYELKNRYEKKYDATWNWINRNKKCFLAPCNEECKIVKDIFRYTKFRESIKIKSILSGSPEADAFIVAKAKHTDGIIVTAENSKPHSAKIPNIAVEYNVPYMTRDEFFRVVRNVEKGEEELKDVTIFY